jgi:Mn-containing catalase
VGRDDELSTEKNRPEIDARSKHRDHGGVAPLILLSLNCATRSSSIGGEQKPRVILACKESNAMYHHVKKLMYTVRVDEPDPRFGNMLLEQFGGANGELAAAMQYSVQGLNCEDAGRKDLLMDIGTEELSHLEIVGTLSRMHLKPLKSVREAAEADPLIAIAGGGGVNLFNSQGNAWTADYLKITGELDVDLRSNIAAEARAKIVYERLINFCRDVGTKDALQFLMTREITHMRAFTLALESMGKPAFSIGRVAPTPKLVDQFFNDSTGEGEYGEVDTRGPWNEGGEWEFVESPAIADLNGFAGGGKKDLL